MKETQTGDEDLKGKKKLPRPTESELAILRVIWTCGPSTVRRVQEELQGEKKTGYTTTLKLMQIMHEKGLLIRDESNRSHVYDAAISKERTQTHLVNQLIAQVFGGSAKKLVVHALSTKKASREELAEIRKLISKMEGESE